MSHPATRLALLAALLTVGACQFDTEPALPQAPSGRYQLEHIRGDPVPGWVKSACAYFRCDSTWVEGGTLEFLGEDGCTWTLTTTAGTQRQEGQACFVSVGSGSIRIRVGQTWGDVAVSEASLTITYANCGPSDWICWQQDWWVYTRSP